MLPTTPRIEATLHGGPCDGKIITITSNTIAVEVPILDETPLAPLSPDTVAMVWDNDANDWRTPPLGVTIARYVVERPGHYRYRA